MNSRLNSIKDWHELAQSSGYCVQTLAKRCRVSVRQLERFFRLKFGQSPCAWLRALRVRQAMELLRDDSVIKETAAMLGYKTTSHFSRDFKRQFGMTPSHYAEREFNPKSCLMSHSGNKCRI
jgi:AraC-like DNA-binding protein